MHWTRLLVLKELTFPFVLIKQCGVVPDMLDRWHHLVLLSLKVETRSPQTSGMAPWKRMETCDLGKPYLSVRLGLGLALGLGNSNHGPDS